MCIEVLKYPHKHDAVEIAERCKGITFVLTQADEQTQSVGTLFAEDGCALSLRVLTSAGVHKIHTAVAIYPGLGLIVYPSIFTIEYKEYS